MAKQFANNGSVQMLHSAVSDMGLHHLQITLLSSPDILNGLNTLKLLSVKILRYTY